MREFGRGARALLHGFGWWRTHPRLMLLGLVPAAIVAVVLFAGLLTLGLNLEVLSEAATPFADAWPEFWATLIRFAVATALLGGAIVVAAITFTALTLLIGEPFYERIWQAAERERGVDVPDVRYGWWRALRDTVSLVLRGIGVGLLAALLGFVPVVGAALSFTVGVTLGGWLLADELASRALAARGIRAADRGRLLRGSRARVLGFGVATQLCFLVPLGAVFTMPAAVAGATELSHALLSRAAPRA